MLTAPRAGAHADDAEPDIPLQQAIANARRSRRAKTPPIRSRRSRALAGRRAGAPPCGRRHPRRRLRCASGTARAAGGTGRRRAATPPAAPPRVGAAPSSTVILSGATEKKYTGNPITLDFSGADLRTVLRYFNEISGLNIIIDPSVPATPIDIVLTRRAVGPGVRNAAAHATSSATSPKARSSASRRSAVLAEEEGERRKLAEAKALAGDLRVQTFALSYAKAGDMSAAAGEVGALAARPDPGRRADQHDHHHRPARPAADRDGTHRRRSIGRSRRSKSRRASSRRRASSPRPSASSGA